MSELNDRKIPQMNELLREAHHALDQLEQCAKQLSQRSDQNTLIEHIMQLRMEFTIAFSRPDPMTQDHTSPFSG